MFFTFQIDLEPVDVDVERVVENDACVESGSQHDVEVPNLFTFYYYYMHFVDMMFVTSVSLMPIHKVIPVSKIMNNLKLKLKMNL